MLLFIFVIIGVLFVSGSESVQFLLSFIYMCIAFGDPDIKRGLGSH